MACPATPTAALAAMWRRTLSAVSSWRTAPRLSARNYSAPRGTPNFRPKPLPLGASFYSGRLLSRPRIRLIWRPPTSLETPQRTNFVSTQFNQRDVGAYFGVSVDTGSKHTSDDNRRSA